jgi:L,D-peptidoglycan transpeptidase YkuD (ErfK/YbiS/YcfS/YnhG family)
MFNCSNHYKILKQKNITIKNNNILRIINIGSKSSKATAHINNTTIHCNIGICGSAYNKTEGDKKTPKGTFFPKKIFYRADKIQSIKSPIKKEIIKSHYRWCDDAKSYNYNKFIPRSFNQSSETMWRNDNLYDLIITTTHNQLPIIKHKGSAIFLHINNDSKKGSLGCITFKESHLRRLILTLNVKTRIYIK